MPSRFSAVVPAALLLAAAPAFSQAPPPAAPGPLPIRQVTLFTSGVSYIERGGLVNGDAAVPLTFRTTQINDILKSMTLIDSTGQVQPATYGAKDPIGRTLQAFAVDVTQNVSEAELLNRLRGARVEVLTMSKEKITGQIVGVEQKTETVKDKTQTVDILNLLTDNGLQSVRLDETRSLKLLDKRLDREFRDALTMLASGSDEQRRQVTLHFAGTGRRPVRVGYVTEAPLWKISYRLLLGGANGTKSEKPYLQGWALVENTTDDDWQGIHLSLVSGRPVSFIQDLYQPLYLPRPVVQPDIIASPEPQTHSENLQDDVSKMSGGFPGSPPVNAPASSAREPALPRDLKVAGRVNSRDEFGAPSGAVFGLTSESFARDRNGVNGQQARNSVIAQAQGEKAGELFQYNITTPVTLPRQQAAMIPVVSQDIDGEKVSLYNADSDPRFPLNAVRIKNTTSLHLKGGPVTLFDGGVYAGDARMEDIPPGDSRLVSYAVDLSVEGERKATVPASTQFALSLKRGVLMVTRRLRQETDYTLKNKSQEPKTVLVEHPFDPTFNLVAPPKADERAADVYRFAVPIDAGKTAALKVIVEKPLSSTVALFDGDLDEIVVYAGRTEISAQTRDVLREVVRRRRQAQELSDQADAKQTEVQSIGQEQERIRKNMGALDHASALYKRYVGELDAQETRIHTLRDQQQALRHQAAEAARALRAYLDTLEIAP